MCLGTVLIQAVTLDQLANKESCPQDLVRQIARQRDMFRKLLQDAAAVSTKAGGAADLQLIASADAQIANNSALQVTQYLVLNNFFCSLQLAL